MYSEAYSVELLQVIADSVDHDLWSLLCKKIEYRKDIDTETVAYIRQLHVLVADNI